MESGERRAERGEGRGARGKLRSDASGQGHEGTHLLTQLQLPGDFTGYVWAQVGALQRQTQERRQLAAIAQGRLPTLTWAVPVELRSGEIPHWHGRAALTLYKERKSGTIVDLHEGTATVTDLRFVFSSATKAVSLGLRQIISLHPHGQDIAIRSSGKGAGLYRFVDQPRLAQAIFRTAVGRANQTIVEQIVQAPIRHIPRDVRQRVWQKYAGRCVDCQATQYLERLHNIVLPFQTIEQVDEPRAETDKKLADPQTLLFDLDTRGRQLKGWTNKQIWGG